MQCVAMVKHTFKHFVTFISTPHESLFKSKLTVPNIAIRSTFFTGWSKSDFKVLNAIWDVKNPDFANYWRITN